MIQFQPYPIYANYSNPQDEERIEREFRAQGDRHMAEWLEKTGRRLFETRPGGITPRATAYEQAVIKQLRVICATRIGKLLFDSLDSATIVWIVPFHEFEHEACGCAAATPPGVFDKKLGGGVRVFYDPADFSAGGQRYTPDDALFHEMVHAYRVGRVKAKGLKQAHMQEYLTAEEFLAIHMQNVYLDCRGKTHYYRSHTDPILRTKDHIYGEFTEDGEVMQALQYYAKFEPLARSVAQWAYPHPNFNPWRDYPQLLRIYRSKSGDYHSNFLPL